MLESNPFAGEVIARPAIVPSLDSPLARCLVAPLTSVATAAPRLLVYLGRNEQEHLSSYCAPLAVLLRLTPETVPVNSPVAAKKTGLFWHRSTLAPTSR